MQNKNKTYPELNNQQLLSLIRTQQIIITDLETRLATMEVLFYVNTKTRKSIMENKKTTKKQIPMERPQKSNHA